MFPEIIFRNIESFVIPHLQDTLKNDPSGFFSGLTTTPESEIAIVKF